MWNYERRLQYPVNIKNPNPALAMVIISQFGGPDSNRYEDVFAIKIRKKP